jgi:raffinose/stachyose/melibiose transport system substrate-binding protein
MRKTFAKVLSLLIAAALLISLAACGGNTGSQAGTNDQSVKTEETTAQEATPEVKEVTLKLWHVWAAESESNRKPFLKVLDDFQAANPNIKLETDETEAQTYLTKIRTTAAANELPDVFYYQAGGLLKNFVDSGKVLCLDDYLKDGTMDRIIPGTLVNMTFDGKVYGLPYTLATAVFFVNKEMFDQNGIKIPETYNELVTAVKAFRAKGITPMTVGAKDLWPTTQYFDLLALRDAGYQACMDALTKKGTYEEPGIIDAAAKLQELVKLKAFNDGALGLTRDESEVPFYEGKIPMYVNGNWTCANIQKEDSKIKGKVLALKFPIIEGGKGDINDFTGGAAEGFYVSSATPYKEEAVKAVKYITENHSKEAFLVGAGMPTWKFDFDESQVDPLILQVVKNTKDAKTFTLWWNTLLESKDSEAYHNELQKLFALDITPEEFAKNMQKMNQ